jgi:hypothetical protein
VTTLTRTSRWRRRSFGKPKGWASPALPYCAGLLGYGASSAIHRYDGFFSRDLPIVVEIIDVEEKIMSFLPVLERMMHGGLITTQQLRIVRALQKTAPTGP